NWRIFAESGTIHALNNEQLLRDADPFRLFEQMGVRDASHAFYLGYEMMKARTALTLSKTYRQDRELQWGFLTVAEVSQKAGRQTRDGGGTSGTGESPAQHTDRGPLDESGGEQA